VEPTSRSTDLRRPYSTAGRISDTDPSSVPRAFGVLVNVVSLSVVT